MEEICFDQTEFFLYDVLIQRSIPFCLKTLLFILHVLQRLLYKNILVLCYKLPNWLFLGHFNEAQ